MDVIDMAWDDEAWDTFTATRRSAPALYAQLRALLTRLASDPGAHDLRRRRLQDPPLFMVTVGTWAIFWDLADDDVPQVWYVGPSPL